MNQLARPSKARVFDRAQHDWYVEEARASAGLFKAERFVGGVHDPACGRGNIVRSALAAGLRATGTDIVARVGADEKWFSGTVNFLTVGAIWAANIVMNPPFLKARGTEAFVRKALDLARAKVAVFAPIGFLAGDKRSSGLFAEHPPSRVYSISPRISCPPGEYLLAGGAAKGGTEEWIWLVWDRTAPHAATTFHWLRADRGEEPL